MRNQKSSNSREGSEFVIDDFEINPTLEISMLKNQTPVSLNKTARVEKSYTKEEAEQLYWIYF